MGRGLFSCKLSWQGTARHPALPNPKLHAPLPICQPAWGQPPEGVGQMSDGEVHGMWSLLLRRFFNGVKRLGFLAVKCSCDAIRNVILNVAASRSDLIWICWSKSRSSRRVVASSQSNTPLIEFPNIAPQSTSHGQNRSLKNRITTHGTVAQMSTKESIPSCQKNCQDSCTNFPQTKCLHATEKQTHKNQKQSCEKFTGGWTRVL